MAVCLVAIAGCQSPTTGVALPPNLAGNDPQAQIDFWHTLPERRVVSNDEAFHALLMLADGQDAANDYPGRVQAMTERGMLPSGFDGSAEGAVRRGTVAVAIYRTLKVEGGLTVRLFGVHPRYACRELEYVNLFPPSSPQQTFSGREFLGIIGRAEDYQRGQAADADIPMAEENATPPATQPGPTTRPAE